MSEPQDQIHQQQMQQDQVNPQQMQKSQLKEDGYSEAEADVIFGRAAELHSQTLMRDGDKMSSSTLGSIAERAGIPAEFVHEAIRQVQQERAAEKAREQQQTAQRAVRIGLIKKVAMIAVPLLLLVAILTHGSLNRHFSAVEERQAQLDNVLQRRRDLIPNLIALTKTSAGHEKAMAASLADLQRQATQSQSPSQRLEVEARLGEQVRGLMTALQSDPQSSTSGGFTRLSDEMAGAENRIAVERKRYNEAVAAYNRTARGFPAFLLRPLLGFPSSRAYFQASPDAQTVPAF
jgi:LemA protein